MRITFLLLLLFVARSALSIGVTSNGLQRASRGNSSLFWWKIDQPIANYTIFNETTGSPTGLRKNSSHNYDNVSGEITLTIDDVQLWDAGNYSLQITQALTTAIDSTVCLYVYGYLSGSLMLSSGRDPSTEGDTLELTCNLTSTSLPAAYRPNVIYISWYIRDGWSPEKTFSGPILDRDGNIIPGYTIKNNGRTLVIGSVQHMDQYISCKGREEGGTFSLVRYHYVEIRYKPFIYSLFPKSKKLNVAYGLSVELGIYRFSRPRILSSSWEFVNRSGVSQNLPPHSSFGPRDSSSTGPDYTWLTFNFNSSEYYGSYSITLTNAIGSTTVTFEVLPEGKPSISIIGFFPESKKFPVAIGMIVYLSVNWNCYPSILSSSWEFVNRSGVSQNLPPHSSFGPRDSSSTGPDYTWLTFIFTSNEYYGSYSITLTNAIGSTTRDVNVTFEVLPEGPPDAPSNVKIKNVTHNAIDVQWNVMCSNSYEHRQRVFWLLTHDEDRTVVYDSSKSYNYDIYNESYSRLFFVKPETNYSLQVWSENKFGSSEVAELQVRTREEPKLIVTTVSQKETEESVFFTTQSKYEDRENKNSLLFTVIALSIFSGIILLACLTLHLMRRFRKNRQPDQSLQLPTVYYQGMIHPPVIEESLQSREDNAYEELENDDHCYARILSTSDETGNYIDLIW